MKISEVIERLGVIAAEHGDVEVMSDGADGAYPIEIGEVQEVVEDGTLKRSQVLFLWGLETVRS